MPKVPVPVLWDEANNFLNSTLYSVDSSSTVVTTVTKPTKKFPPQDPNPATQTCVQLKTTDFGTLYLNMPLSAYQDAIRAASGSPEPLIKTIIYKPLVDGNTITDPALTGSTIIAAWVGGVSQDITGILTGDVLTFLMNLNGETVGVIYYTN